jgi:hypothetical protein
VQHNHRYRQQAPVVVVVVVGYAMREARERALAQAGLLHFVPRGAGEDDSSAPSVVFMPLKCGDGGDGNDDDDEPATSAPLIPPIVHVLLHKASDYLRVDNAGEYVVSKPLRRLLASAEASEPAAPRVVVVDPLQAVADCVFDRRGIAAVLAAAFDDPTADDDALDTASPAAWPPPGISRVRAPKQLALASPPATMAVLASALAAAGVPGPPYIVKTAAACGLPESHRMAVALSDRGLWEALGGGGGGDGDGGGRGAPSQPPQQQPPQLLPPYPLVVQEFVDHGGLMHKVYVLGDELVYAAAPARPSIPDLSAAVEALRQRRRQEEQQQQQQQQHPLPLPPHLLTFDALKSLPTTLPWQGGGGDGGDRAPAATLDPRAVSAVATRLRRATRLWRRRRRQQHDDDGGGSGLSLFGFDVVVASESARAQGQEEQEWVVVDLNYLPNYRGGGERAAAAWRAVLWRARAAGTGAAATRE